MYFFLPSTTLRWPISHHLLWLTPFWRSSTLTLLPRHRRTGTHKADGGDNSSLPCRRLGEEDGTKVWWRRAGSRHPAERSMGFSQWHPCPSGFKERRVEGPDSDGWWSAGCLLSFVLQTEAVLRARGEKGILFMPFSSIDKIGTARKVFHQSLFVVLLLNYAIYHHY